MDKHQWQSVSAPLFDGEIGLTGKPDYIAKRGDQIIPIEIKSGRKTTRPYEAHIFQLAAYCYLIEKEFHQKPAYGLIHYTTMDNMNRSRAPQTFAIEYTEDLASSFLATISQMRASENQLEIPRSHQSHARCHRCGYQSGCDQRL